MRSPLIYLQLRYNFPSRVAVHTHHRRPSNVKLRYRLIEHQVNIPVDWKGDQSTMNLIGFQAISPVDSIKIGWTIAQSVIYYQTLVSDFGFWFFEGRNQFTSADWRESQPHNSPNPQKTHQKRNNLGETLKICIIHERCADLLQNSIQIPNPGVDTSLSSFETAILQSQPWKGPRDRPIGLNLEIVQSIISRFVLDLNGICLLVSPEPWARVEGEKNHLASRGIYLIMNDLAAFFKRPQIAGGRYGTTINSR